METYAKAQKNRKRNTGRKRNKGLKITLLIIGAILLLLLCAALIFLIKMKRMSRNAVPTLPTVIELPDVTAIPAELVTVDQPDFFNVPDGDTPLGDDVLNALPDDDDYEDEYPDDPGIPLSSDGIYYVPRINQNIINILVLGNDARSENERGRTDSMMLLSYNMTTRKAKLVSFLRDTWIYIPGRDKWNRLNAAYQFGGVGLLINTLNVNFGLDIQYYIRVGFNSMKELIDDVGGIDMELSVREIQYINKRVANPQIPETAGVHHLTGAQALRHSRNRYVGNYDWSRAERQRKVMYAILERARKEPNPVSLMALMYRLADKLDTNMNIETMTSLGVNVVFGGAFSMDNRAVPFEGTWSYAYERRMAVVKTDIAANKTKLLAYLYGQ